MNEIVYRNNEPYFIIDGKKEDDNSMNEIEGEKQMYPRTNFEMTKEDLEVIMDACKPTPVMKIGSYTGSSPQENANRSWQVLGKKMGFDHMTVRPIQGKSMNFFSATPSETTSQKEERLIQEAEKKRLSEIDKLEDEIAERESRLIEIREST